MDISTTMNAADQSRVSMQVDSFNKALNNGRVAQQEMGKDDFMQILITQLANQDPTAPMEDKEFIAQMAQFSSLEQMTNMSTQFSDVAERLNSSRAIGSLGQEVDILFNGEYIRGTVDAVTGGDYPQVMVEGHYYDFETVQTIYSTEGEA